MRPAALIVAAALLVAGPLAAHPAAKAQTPADPAAAVKAMQSQASSIGTGA